jgi:hypothetical protein
MHIPPSRAVTTINVDVQEDELLVERKNYTRTQCLLESWLEVLKLPISYNRHVHMLKGSNISVKLIYITM